jgi:hypothetical protein
LHNVGAVETVHTICAEDAVLPRSDGARDVFGVGDGSVKDVTDLGEETAYVLKAHAAAFFVKVKPGPPDLWESGVVRVQVGDIVAVLVSHYCL